MNKRLLALATWLSLPAAFSPAVLAQTPTLAPPTSADTASAPAPGSTAVSNSLDFNGQAPAAPLMGTITQEVAFTIDKQPIQRGPFVGVVVHLHNGTNSPLMFDGDRARIKVGEQMVTAVSDVALEQVAAPPPSKKHDAKLAVADAITVGAYSTARDIKIERGPILPRYGPDQMRREATLERFGPRILFPGDDTQGIVFFQATGNLDASPVELPVVTFPGMEIRGYLSGTR